MSINRIVAGFMFLALCFGIFSCSKEKTDPDPKPYDEMRDELWAALEDELSEDELVDFGHWYMLGIYGVDAKDVICDKAATFIDSHKTLLDAIMEADRNDPAILDELEAIKKNDDEGLFKDGKDAEGDGPEDPVENESNGGRDVWMGSGFGTMKSGLPDNRLVCHVSLPGSHASLARDMEYVSIKQVPWFFRSLVGKIVVKAAKAQYYTIHWQLEYGVRAFDFRYITHEIKPKVYDLRGSNQLSVNLNAGGTAGNGLIVPLPFAAKAYVGDGLEEIAKFVESHRSEFVIVMMTAEDGDDDTEKWAQRALSDVKKRHNGLFIDFKADMRVKEARGHVIVIWENDTEVLDRSIPQRFWASMPGNEAESKKDSICTWSQTRNEWVKAADLWVQNEEALGVAMDDQTRTSEVHKKLTTMRNMMSDYKNAVMGPDVKNPVPIWFENSTYCYFYMHVPGLFLKKMPLPYANIAYTTHYFNYYAYPFLGKWDGPAGIVLISYSCRNWYIWRAPGAAHCKAYAADMVDNVITLNSRYTMPYE